MTATEKVHISACFWTNLCLSALLMPNDVFIQARSAQQFACAIRSDTRLTCWGTVPTANPMPPADAGVRFAFFASYIRCSFAGYSWLTAGQNNMCAVRTSDNRVVCWGATANSIAGQVRLSFLVFCCFLFPDEVLRAVEQDVQGTIICGKQLNGWMVCNWGDWTDRIRSVAIGALLCFTSRLSCGCSGWNSICSMRLFCVFCCCFSRLRCSCQY